MSHKFVVAVAALAGAVVIPLAAASPVAAAPPGGNFCSINVGTERMVCVATAAELPSAQAQAARSGGVTPAATYIIAKLYDNAGFNASAGVLEVTAGAACTTSKTNVDASLSNLGVWSDRISSFQGYANCYVQLWGNPGFAGASLGYYSGTSNVGSAMNDRASSARFS